MNKLLAEEDMDILSYFQKIDRMVEKIEGLSKNLHIPEHTRSLSGSL